tara:strand:- start:127 stop:561 length:435 start_codon:yes stop_codon:yes gene_type:complete
LLAHNNVLEGLSLTTNNLMSLVALSSDENEISCSGFTNRRVNCGGSIENDSRSRRPLPSSLQNLVSYVGWVLRPGIVRRDDHFVSQPGSYFPHHGPFGLVAIAACAKYNPYAPFCDTSSGFQSFGKSVRFMGIVDQNAQVGSGD